MPRVGRQAGSGQAVRSEVQSLRGPFLLVRDWRACRFEWFPPIRDPAKERSQSGLHHAEADPLPQYDEAHAVILSSFSATGIEG